MGPYGTDLSSGSAYVDDTQEPSREIDDDDGGAAPLGGTISSITDAFRSGPEGSCRIITVSPKTSNA